MNPLTINMEFSYEYTIIQNTENITLNLDPKQNALFQALNSAEETGYSLNYSTKGKKTSKIDLLLDRIGKKLKCYLFRDSTYI